MGEFDRLFGKFESSYERLTFCTRDWASVGFRSSSRGRMAATVTPPHKQVVFNSSGNAGLATAGSGDVLTGILLAFFRQRKKSDRGKICV